MPNKGDYETVESRAVEGAMALHIGRQDGTVTMVDTPAVYDKQDTVAALIISVPAQKNIVRCALTKAEAVSLVRALLGELV